MDFPNPEPRSLAPEYKKIMNRKIIQTLAVMSLGVFLQGCCALCPRSEAAKTRPVATQLVKSTNSWDGASLPAYPQGQPEIRILRIAIPAGVKLDMHEHPVINAGVLTRGQLTVVAKDGKTLQLKEGDPIVELVNTWHYGFNPGKTDSEIVVFYAGVVEKPITEYEPSAKHETK